MPPQSQHPHIGLPWVVTLSPLTVTNTAIQVCPFLEGSAQSITTSRSVPTLEPSLGLCPRPGPEHMQEDLAHSSRLPGLQDGPSLEGREGGRNLHPGSPLPSRSFPHLADIQVLLQVIGVVQL